jgi:hypothetical protein
MRRYLSLFWCRGFGSNDRRCTFPAKRSINRIAKAELYNSGNGRTRDVDRTPSTDPLRDHIFDSRKFKNRPYRSSRKNTTPFPGGTE